MQPKKGKGREEMAIVITEGGSGMKTQALWRYEMECVFFVSETVLAGGGNCALIIDTNIEIFGIECLYQGQRQNNSVCLLL